MPYLVKLKEVAAPLPGQRNPLYLSAENVGWRSFCAGIVCSDFRAWQQAPESSWYNNLLEGGPAVSPKNAAKAYAEEAAKYGFGIFGDLVDGIGNKNIISLLPKRWTNKKKGRKYFVHVSKPTRNVNTGSPVLVCYVRMERL